MILSETLLPCYGWAPIILATPNSQNCLIIHYSILYTLLLHQTGDLKPKQNKIFLDIVAEKQSSLKANIHSQIFRNSYDTSMCGHAISVSTYVRAFGDVEGRAPSVLCDSRLRSCIPIGLLVCQLSLATRSSRYATQLLQTTRWISIKS